MEIVEHVNDIDFFIKESSRLLKKKWHNVCCYLKQNIKIIRLCNCGR